MSGSPSSSSRLPEVDYTLPKMSKKRWVVLLLCSFIFGCFVAFPFFQSVENKLKALLATIPGCSISFSKLDYEIFLPKLIMKDVTVPSRCLKLDSAEPVQISEIRLNFRLISFAPFGPHFKLETEIFKNPISAYLTFSLFNHAINIKENIIDLAKVSPLIPNVDLKGKVTINSFVEFNSKNISKLKLVASSKDLIIPGQRIMGFTIFPLAIKNFLVKGQMDDKGKFNLEDFILGDTESPIRSNFKGKIDLKPSNISLSKLDLKGEVFFSDEFLEKLALIKMAMAQYTQKDKFYQLEISGQMGRPQVKSPTK